MIRLLGIRSLCIQTSCCAHRSSFSLYSRITTPKECCNGHRRIRKTRKLQKPRSKSGPRSGHPGADRIARLPFAVCWSSGRKYAREKDKGLSLGSHPRPWVRVGTTTARHNRWKAFVGHMMTCPPSCVVNPSRLCYCRRHLLFVHIQVANGIPHARGKSGMKCTQANTE